MKVSLKDLEEHLHNQEVLLALLQEAEKDGVDFSSDIARKFVKYAVNEDTALVEAFRDFVKEQGEWDVNS